MKKNIIFYVGCIAMNIFLLQDIRASECVSWVKPSLDSIKIENREMPSSPLRKFLVLPETMKFEDYSLDGDLPIGQATLPVDKPAQERKYLKKPKFKLHKCMCAYVTRNLKNLQRHKERHDFIFTSNICKMCNPWCYFKHAGALNQHLRCTHRLTKPYKQKPVEQ